MRCKKARRLLSDYLDSQVSDNLKSDLGVHLKQCKNCSEFLKDLQETNEIVKLKANEHPPEEPWDSYWPRLKERLEKVEVPSGSGAKQRKLPVSYPLLPKLRLAMNGALTVLIILAAVLLYHSSREITSLRNTLAERQDGEGEKLPLSQLILTSPESMPRQARLFQEIREAFPRHAQWVVTDNDKIDLGISSYVLSEKVATGAELSIFLHFNIIRLDGLSAQSVSSPKMMILNGQEVNVKLDGLSKEDKTIYRYRCLPELRPDGKINLAVRISLDTSTLETAITIDKGEIIELGRLKRGDVQYVIHLRAQSKNLPIPELSEET